ncbi:MAG: hypothetical protein U0527_14970 [Candidatus Eisenbacteria bacterium]
MNESFAVLAEGKLPQLKELRRALSARGIESELMQPPGGCGSG